MNAASGTIGQVASALRSRTVTSRSITDRCLTAIAERDPALNAFITVLGDAARDQAEQADAEMDAGQYRGPLHGVPISLKDLIDVRDQTTSAASRVRQGHIAAADATVVTRLREAGAVIVGKTNLHEFAFGTTNEDSAFGPARHPLDPSRSPGGSSGGSAVSVLADMAYASIGTDTGGSVRIPSAVCGLVGLKPTLDEIPVDGVVPLSGTMDHVGPLCRSVEDAGILYDVLSGATRAVGSQVPDAHGLRLGVLRGYFMAVVDSEVAERFERACRRLQAAGVELHEVDIRHANDIAPIYLHIVLSEAAAYHAATLESHADVYTPNVRLRLEMGRYILAEDYVRALHGRDVLRREVDSALTDCDGLLLPTLPIPAPTIGSGSVRIGGVEESVRNITMRLTQLFNLTGHPAISMPCGSTREGWPVGAQLVGHRHCTPALLDMASAIEPYLS
jgi:aspartyl-tRNA(Asn)/glutamyl-tRNA(Gln) amidotransferase subunit A